MQNIVQILESVQLKWELFQSWTDFSRLHLSNKLAIFGIGYNTRWKEDIVTNAAEISSQVPLGKRLREYFNSENPRGPDHHDPSAENELEECILQISGDHYQAKLGAWSCTWKLTGSPSPTPNQLVGMWFSIYCQEAFPKAVSMPLATRSVLRGLPPPCGRRTLDPEEEGRVDLETLSAQASLQVEIEPTRIIYCYLGIAEVRTLQQCLFLHFQANTKTFSKDWVGINGFLSQNCIVDPGVSPKSIYIKFVEVERIFFLLAR